ncbi:hypothetical protein D3C81_1843960 [compost metagenome]
MKSRALKQTGRHPTGHLALRDTSLTRYYSLFLIIYCLLLRLFLQGCLQFISQTIRQRCVIAVLLDQLLVLSAISLAATALLIAEHLNDIAWLALCELARLTVAYFHLFVTLRTALVGQHRLCRAAIAAFAV